MERWSDLRAAALLLGGPQCAGVAAFIVQLTTVIVPLLEAFVYKTRIPALTWAACLLALTGVTVFASDGLLNADPSAVDTTALQGDALVALGAVFYSWYVP